MDYSHSLDATLQPIRYDVVYSNIHYRSRHGFDSSIESQSKNLPALLHVYIPFRRSSSLKLINGSHASISCVVLSNQIAKFVVTSSIPIIPRPIIWSLTSRNLVDQSVKCERPKTSPRNLPDVYFCSSLTSEVAARAGSTPMQ